jgi:hypothetical protein
MVNLKQYTSKAVLIYDGTADFKARYSDQLATSVKDANSVLFDYVMQSQKKNASFNSFGPALYTSRCHLEHPYAHE